MRRIEKTEEMSIKELCILEITLDEIVHVGKRRPAACDSSSNAPKLFIKN